MDKAPGLFSRRPYWAKRFGIAPFMPMSRAEMEALGWDSCDVILVTGDAYVDHPSFGVAVIGRLLEAQGFRVGIIAQPNWRSAEAFRTLGRPNLYFGVTAGNMDSMVNRYTADRKIRSDDAYTPNAEPNHRPDRAVTVYAQRCKEAFPGITVVLGGIEASLRRIAHYDYWSDTMRRSVLVDAKADMLLFGNAERAVVELTHRLAAGEVIQEIRDLRGTAFLTTPGWLPPLPKHLPREGGGESEWVEVDALTQESAPHQNCVIRLPSFEQVQHNKTLDAHASRIFHLESNPGNARALVQRHGDGPGARDVWLNPPPIPLTTPEIDGVFDLPYARAPHPVYGGAKIPAWDMIRFSVNIMRGCFGGCTFCSITEHEGRIIQSRSKASVLREIEQIRDKAQGFTGVISDIGGPTANMYRMACKDPKIESACRRLSCVFPDICPNMDTDHSALIELYREARALPGVKKVLIGSGVRYDIAVRSPEYVKELAQHHVGGYLKIAPEHTEEGPLNHMMKPRMTAYDRFKQLFDQFSKEVGKEQYLIPYFIAAHPGTTDLDMLNLALWLKKNGFRLDQVQTFLPTPLALATTMYHSEINPLKKVLGGKAQAVPVVKQGRVRKLHKAFLRYHDPENWPLLREALKVMGRADLIGNGKKHLIPDWQPAGTGSHTCSRTGEGRTAGKPPTRPRPGKMTTLKPSTPRRPRHRP